MTPVLLLIYCTPLRYNVQASLPAVIIRGKRQSPLVHIISDSPTGMFRGLSRPDFAYFSCC